MSHQFVFFEIRQSRVDAQSSILMVFISYGVDGHFNVNVHTKSAYWSARIPESLLISSDQSANLNSFSLLGGVG